MKPKEFILESIDSISMSDRFFFVFSSDSSSIKVYSKKTSGEKCFGEKMVLSNKYKLTLFVSGSIEINRDSVIDNKLSFIENENRTIRIHERKPLFRAKEIPCNDVYNSRLTK